MSYGASDQYVFTHSANSATERLQSQKCPRGIALPDRWSYGERETVGGGAAAGSTRLVLWQWRPLVKIRGTRFHGKAELESFPTVYDTPIYAHIGVSYTVGKLLSLAFQQMLKFG